MNYQVYDTQYHTLWEYFIAELRNLGYPYSVLYYTILVLVPFQIIKDVYYKIENNTLSLFLNCLILTMMTVIFYTFIVSLYTTEFQLSFFIKIILIGLINAILLYAFLDRYLNKKVYKQGGMIFNQ